jgi:diguanylate cyclase (GGDEF)-like protein/PAS domain S-box-containing protein
MATECREPHPVPDPARGLSANEIPFPSQYGSPTRINMKRLNPQRVVALGLAVILSLIAGMAGMGLWRMNQVEKALVAVAGGHHQHAKLGYQMQRAARERALLLLRMAATRDPFERQELAVQISQQGAVFIAARDRLLGLTKGVEERVELQDLMRLARTAAPLMREVSSLYQQGEDTQAYRILTTQAMPAQQRLLDGWTGYMERESERIDLATRRAQRQYHKAVRDVAIFSAIALITSVVVGWLVSRNVQRIMATLQRMIGRLRNQNSREWAIRSTMLDGLITAGADGVIRSANPAAGRMFGYDKGELVGRKLNELMPEPHRSEHDNYIQNYLQTGEAHIIGTGREVEVSTRSGELVPVELGITHLIHHGEDLFVGILHDIRDRKLREQALEVATHRLEQKVRQRTRELQVANTRLSNEVAERKQAQELLAKQASHDPLTGLANRRLFQELLDQAESAARRHGQKLSLMYLDLDGFKAVNDRLGHHAGDELLRAIAHRIHTTLRQEDVVARLGGDEFVILLDRVGDQEQLGRIAEKLQTIISEPVAIAEQEAQVGVSIGIASFPDAPDGSSLMRCADLAMYEAKHAGRGQYRFGSCSSL